MARIITFSRHLITFSRHLIIVSRHIISFPVSVARDLRRSLQSSSSSRLGGWGGGGSENGAILCFYLPSCLSDKNTVSPTKFSDCWYQCSASRIIPNILFLGEYSAPHFCTGTSIRTWIIQIPREFPVLWKSHSHRSLLFYSACLYNWKFTQVERILLGIPFLN